MILFDALIFYLNWHYLLTLPTGVVGHLQIFQNFYSIRRENLPLYPTFLSEDTQLGAFL